MTTWWRMLKNLPQPCLAQNQMLWLVKTEQLSQYWTTMVSFYILTWKLCLIKIFSALVSFEPTSYTVTEGEDATAVVRLVRSGDLSRATIVTVTPTPGSAEGMHLCCTRLYLFSSLSYSYSGFHSYIYRCDIHTWSNNSHGWGPYHRWLCIRRHWDVLCSTIHN